MADAAHPISMGQSLTILQRVNQDPQVVDIEARLQAAQQQLDKVQLTRAAQRDDRIQMDYDLYSRCFEMEREHQRQVIHAVGPLILMGTIAGGLALSFLVPAVNPARSLILLGTLVGTFWGVPKVMGVVFNKLIMPRATDRRMCRVLDAEQGQFQQRIKMLDAQKAATIQQVTQSLYQQASQEQAAAQEKAAAQPPPLSTDEHEVHIGDVSVPKKG